MKKTSTIELINGTPTLMANGAPLPAPVFCLLGDQALRTEVVSTLHCNGIGAFAVRNAMSVGSGQQTKASIATAVARLVNVARAAPGAWLMPDCDVFPSESWMIAHPHEGYITADRRILVLGKDGASDRRETIQVPGPALGDVKGKDFNGEEARILYGRRRVSLFSEAFANEVTATVRTLLAELRDQGLSNRVGGIFIGCYVYGEWNPYLGAPDHSRVALRGFRRYLERQYRDNRTLQAAWDDPSVTLKKALPPREYSQTDLAPLKPQSARHADYQAAEAQAMAEQFKIMAHRVKRLVPNAVVGGFFPGANPPQSDWLRLIQNPAVDFLATPLAYENRGPGCGTGSQSPFCDGFLARNKVWFDELDTRTLRADPKTNYPYGRPRTLADSLNLLWRDAGQMLIRGHHGWWLDFGRNGKPPYSWHLDPETLEFHRRFSTIWNDIGSLDRRPLEEIKVFIPSTAARHFQILYHADYQRHTEWTLLGAPVEWEVLENLLEGRSPPGKLNVIYGAACLSAKQLRLLKSRLRAHPSFVVWMGGTGLHDAGRPLDAARSENVIPIHQEFFALNAPLALAAQTTPEADAWLGLSSRLLMGQYDRLLTSGFVNGPDDLNVPMQPVPVSWKLIVTDTDAIPLARQVTGCSGLEVTMENDRPERVPLSREITDAPVLVAAKKDAAGTTHVVYNLPVLNTGVFRALAQKAGCHLFTEKDDVVFASKGLVLLHAAYSGLHTLSFPRRVRIVDLRQGTALAGQTDRLQIKLRRGETRLFQWS